MSSKLICCKNCDKLLMAGEIIDGYIDKKCPGCGKMNHITREGVEIIEEQPKNDKPFQDRLKREMK